MSRDVSLSARQALYAQETGEVFLLLLTIDHTSLAAPIRVVNNTVDVISRGLTFLAFPFEITLPDDDAETLSGARLTISNVDRQIVQAVRSISGAPSVLLEVIMASAPDTVEAGPFDFTLRQAQYDAQSVSGALVFEDILNMAIPAHTMTPQLFPGLH